MTKRSQSSHSDDKVEIKSSLTFDYEDNKPSEYLEQSAIKSIPAFMVADGGILVIGISAKREIQG